MLHQLGYLYYPKPTVLDSLAINTSHIRQISHSARFHVISTPSANTSNVYAVCNYNFPGIQSKVSKFSYTTEDYEHMLLDYYKILNV